MLPDRNPEPAVAVAVTATRGRVIIASVSSSTDRAFRTQSRTMYPPKARRTATKNALNVYWSRTLRVTNVATRPPTGARGRGGRAARRGRSARGSGAAHVQRERVGVVGLGLAGDRLLADIGAGAGGLPP